MRIVWSAIIVGFVMAGAIAEGQEARGKILGTVQDASGLVPGANVKITNVDTGTSLQFVTNGQGYFEAPLLQPGTYDVTAEMAGYKTATPTGLQLAVAQQATVSFTLEFGQVNEMVVEGVRGQALSFLNMSLTRTVRLSGDRNFQLRVDVQTVLNRQHWQNASTNPTSTNFGKVTTVTQNYMRFFTFVGKVNF